MSIWIKIMSKVKPQRGNIVLCHCPEWSEFGYQVAKWTGIDFAYPEQPNDSFNACVKSWKYFKDAD